jgi:dTDP-4-amino-4,6-dideoxygalactose transaminase
MPAVAKSEKQTAAETSLPTTAGSAVGSPPLAFEFLDLKAQFATIRDEVMSAIADVMESQQFILGSEVKFFEEDIAALLGARHAISCASGSDALILAMLALEIGPGDEVITSPFTFFATGGSIARVGAKPVFVDIDARTFNIEPDRIQAAVTSRTRAIMPVHLFGLPADMDAIGEIAKSKGLAVIEDAAQAIGARYRNKCVGTFGEFGCFSFFPSKNLGGAGDGGLITTEDGGLADRVRLLRVHGSRQKYHHQILGVNSRLDALQAAILRVKLSHLLKWTEGRRSNAERYRLLFEKADLTRYVGLPSIPGADFTHVYNQFVIRSSKRDQLRSHLRDLGIPTEVYYPIPLHLQPAFAYLCHSPGKFPQSEEASREAAALPIYPELTDRQQEVVVRAIAEFYASSYSSHSANT